ncbi:MAG TPA: primase C-terminal domain-containing protein, partial [Thermodesulfovibrio thiophilus]|nr:primase C-terminal domain-containing protein [Thermodesulfovibrio thiophilus]
NKFPTTPTVKTGKGYHLYYKYKEGVGNFQKREDLKDIDLRGDGGYVIAPPSIHPEKKIEYEWIVKPTMPFMDIPELVLQKPQQKTKLTELYKGVTEGERNNVLTRLVGSWVSDGLSYNECLENALLWNSKNEPPLNEKEVETTVKSIFERHRKIDILPPTFEITEIPFGLEMFNPQLKLYFKLKNIHQDKEGLKCYLEIRCEDDRALAKDIYSANFNFYSSRGTSDLSRIISSNLPYLSNATQVVESFKKEFKSYYINTPVTKTKGRKLDYNTNFLVMPFVLKDSLNLIYGLGATGKSTFACYLATIMKAKGINVLYLDYENPTPKNIEDTISRIDERAHGILIKNCRAKLTHEVEQIYEVVRKENIQVVIVDSVVKSMLDDVFKPEAVSQYTSALFQIPVTWLLLSHVAKNSPDGDPYGSVFFFNDARNIWFAKKVANGDSNIIQLIHRKSNYTKLFPSALFEIIHEEDRTIVRQKSIEDMSTITDMILVSLSEEPKTFAQLKKDLPSINANKLTTYLARLKKKNRVTTVDGVWYLNEDDATNIPSNTQVTLK